MELPTASKDAVKKDEKRDGQKSAARKAITPVTTAVSVVSVRSEIGALKAIRIP